MSSVPTAAWRVVARRVKSDKPILAAVFMAVLLAVTLMAAGPIYIDAITLSSLQRTLVDSPAADANVVVSTRVEPATFQETDDLVIEAFSRTFSAPGAALFRRGTSESYLLNGSVPGRDEITVFRWFTGIDDHANLVDGIWPRIRNDRLEVAVSNGVAAHLGLAVGDRFEVESRSQPQTPIELTVSGVYEVTDLADPYWLDDDLDVTGMTESMSSTTVGPLVVDFTVFYNDIAPATSAMRWSAFPDFAAFEVADMSPLVGHIDRLDETFNSGREVNNRIHVETELSAILRETGRSLLVTRSAVLALTVQMAILAVYALLLAANLLADSREVETHTLRARGSSSRQLLTMSAMEGLILTLPALFLGPYLAAWSLRALNGIGPLTTIGLDIDPQPVPESWLLAGVAALGCIAALSVPAYRSARRFGNVRADRSRQESTSPARRAGVDIALLVIAGLGLWQLATYGAALTRTVQGTLVIDPLLVAAPALALLAGAVLSLRALPLLARLGERLVARGRHLTQALGLWHLSRQSKRFSRSALMLTLALAVGVFALAYDATWQKSQNDQAGFQAGVDIEAVPSTVRGSLPAHVLDDAYSSLEEIGSLTPVLEGSGEIVGATMALEYRGLDAGTASDLLIFREDQAAAPIDQLMDDLGSARPEPWGIELAGQPATVAVDVSMTLEELEVNPTGPTSPSGSGFGPRLRAVVLDGNGIPWRFDMGEIDQTGEPVRMLADLHHMSPSGDVFTPTYPLRLIGFETTAAAPFAPYLRTASLAVSAVETSEDGSTWDSVEVAVDPSLLSTGVSPLRAADEFPELNLVSADRSGVIVEVTSGTTGDPQIRHPVQHMIWLDDRPVVDSLPVLVSSSFAEEVGVTEGDTIPLAGLPQYDGPATVVGFVDTFPTVDPNTRHAAVIDYPTYAAAVLDVGVQPTDPSVYWIDLEESHIEKTAERLRDEPFASRSVTTRDEVLESLALDPTSLGTIGSLLVGLVAALILAAIGFLVNVAVTNRSRRSQFALMRAIGLPNRQLLKWVTTENGVIVLFSLAVGIGLGVILSMIVLPLTAVTQEATTVVPPLEVVIPWTRIAVLVVAALALLVAAVLMTRSTLRRLEPATLLRSGEE